LDEGAPFQLINADLIVSPAPTIGKGHFVLKQKAGQADILKSILLNGLTTDLRILFR
jgi:hypothetical protein